MERRHLQRVHGMHEPPQGDSHSQVEHYESRRFR